jgi:signal transduction histidine kinase
MLGQHMMVPGSRGFISRMLESGITLADPSGVVIASSQFELGSTLAESALSSATAITMDGETVGMILLPDELPLSPDANLVARVGQSLLAAALAAGLAALIIGGLLIYGLLRPVRELTAAARALATGDLSRRVAVRSIDELGELSQTFNQMAANLERAEALRKEMTADIAHELRNPLAVIQARLEAIMDGVNPATSENINAVLEQSHLLNRLVEDLRTLALVDAGQLALERKDVNLVTLLRRAAKAHADQARLKDVTIRVEAQGLRRLDACVDPIRMEQVLANLLSNAVRHSPMGGEVILSLEADEGRVARIQVMDAGGGIPQEALEQVFARFYRGDKGRSRQEGGTGLGLAIARKLVEAHGGTIWAGNRPEGGAVFSLNIPQQAP